ncbi:class I SAM-dependent methyltransferase [Candidatus Marinimicrobia bacterium MT.SAG.4]|nr:class I SAM-dependent methyltransferase [Candidatus Marinimicrobia bacterium MT.SAG.4]
MNDLIPCPACNKNEFETLLKKRVRKMYDISIVKCGECGLVFNNPVLEEQLLQQFIFEDYYQSKEISSHIDRRFVRHFKRRARTHLKLISGFYQKEFTGRALDIGCGAGFFLNEIRKQGWSVRGIEPDANCSQYAVNKLDIEVFRGLFKQYETGDKFDLIYFSHVFDDLPEISAVLDKVKEMLTSDGRIFIEVPNNNADKNFLKVKDGDFLENKCYFTVETLLKLLKNNGFKILYSKMKEPVYINTFWQWVISPIVLTRKLFPDRLKSLIRVIAAPI